MSALPILTLFTDAGQCPDTKAGSYAAWAKFNGRTMRKSGILKGDCIRSDVAEVRALANGIYLALKCFSPPPGSVIVAQCDCETALRGMMGLAYTKKPKKHEDVCEAIAMAQKMIQDAGVSVRYKHVKGHQGTLDKRSAVNSWCDEQCTFFLRRARAFRRAKA